MVKLKHLSLISDEKISIENWETILFEIVGLSRNWFIQKLTTKRKVNEAVVLINKVREFNPESDKINEDCEIKSARSSDFLPFIAVMELVSNLGKETKEEDVAEWMADIISIACYTPTTGKKYDSSKKSFHAFREKVLDSSLIDMFALFNSIKKELVESQEIWSERFESVRLEDLDFEQAGGDRMGQFNVITTVKTICRDFNLPLHEAWQVPYNMVQMSSYEKATENHIQDGMRIIKEAKMNAKRGA